MYMYVGVCIYAHVTVCVCKCVSVCEGKMDGTQCCGMCGYFGQLTKAVVVISDQHIAKCAVAVV